MSVMYRQGDSRAGIMFESRTENRTLTARGSPEEGAGQPGGGL